MTKILNAVFDFDSTLVTIEGIDELARLNQVEKIVEEMTKLAMNGEMELDEIFLKRLEIIKPTSQNIMQVSDLYRQNITPGAKEIIRQLSDNANIFVVSGGYKSAIVKTTNHLKIKNENVFANELIFNLEGKYININRKIPLWKKGGKEQVIKRIKSKYPLPTILIGDGYSDYEAANSVDKFVCFAGVANRKMVTKVAQNIIFEFNELMKFL